MSDQYGALPHQFDYEKEIKRLRVALADALDGLEHVTETSEDSSLVSELQPYIYRAVAALHNIRDGQ